jgi:hypothetical protein
VIVVGALQEVRKGKGKRIGQDHRDRVVVTVIWHSGDDCTVGAVHQLEAQRGEPHPGHAGGERTDRGQSLHTATGADHATSAAAQRRASPTHRHRADACCFHHRRVITAEEHTQQVGALLTQWGKGLRDGGLRRGNQVGIDRQTVTEAGREHCWGRHGGPPTSRMLYAPLCLDDARPSPVQQDEADVAELVQLVSRCMATPPRCQAREPGRQRRAAAGRSSRTRSASSRTESALAKWMARAYAARA